MTFKLAAVNTVQWPVTVQIPADGGKTVKSSFTAEFRVLSQEEVEQNGAEGGDLLDKALVGWKGVSGDDNEEKEFNPENKKTLLGITYVRAALFGAYMEVQQGRVAARKN